jgi:hypothetical protein
MCTVSFIPVEGKIFITSNRDEKRLRAPATPPHHYDYPSCEMIFPKDGKADGSWISLCDNGNAAVLLNGAFEAHEKKTNYRKSRGLVFLEIMDADYPLKKFFLTSLSGIEPFTIILWQYSELWELRWDDSGTKHSKWLSKNHPHIWSSSTLYDKEIQQTRKGLFNQWLANQIQPTLDEIIRFHRFGVQGSQQNSFFLNKEKICTVSITAMELGNRRGKMVYTDFIIGNTIEEELLFY